MEFILTGFSQAGGIRRYAFRGTAAGASQEFTVETDVGLLRRYGIALQELPLLCRRLLERDAAGQETHILTFSEDLMREHADHCEAVQRAALEKRKSHRKPNPSRLGQHWRGPAL
ncbi:MAG TPA: hypothetical protein VJ732_11250 [Bryobacteraceae bacterium]|nr:hypothetical protein [Bryobacteraceae bacterium]